MKKLKKKYLCRHCGSSWDEIYLAELCFKIDMENLEREKLEKPVKSNLRKFQKQK
jgi:predicted metal-dependent TIM-barrel fold hydrolase